MRQREGWTQKSKAPSFAGMLYKNRGRILGRNRSKSLKSFPRCYSQSPLLTEFPIPPPPLWAKVVWNWLAILTLYSETSCLRTLKITRLCPETFMNSASDLYTSDSVWVRCMSNPSKLWLLTCSRLRSGPKCWLPLVRTYIKVVFALAFQCYGVDRSSFDRTSPLIIGKLIILTLFRLLQCTE